jgi:hypothetical protein
VVTAVLPWTAEGAAAPSSAGQFNRRRDIPAAGELATAKMLALLPASFTVVNDLEFKRFNVDHVVVGKTGVWVVETKSHAGIVEERANGVWLNGRRTYHDPRRQARAAAVAVAELLQRETG